MSSTEIDVGSPQFMKDLAAFLEARKNTKRHVFRDLWVIYERWGSAKTDSGKPRIKGWKAQRTHGKLLMAYFGDTPWDQINLRASDAYREKRAQDINHRTKVPGIKASTRNREMRTAQACLTHAVKKGLISHNPLAGMEDEASEHDRDFSLTQDQVASIMRVSRPLLRWFLVILNETGMRRGEVLSMEWTEVDLDTGYMVVLASKAKSGKKREVPLSVNARAVLEMMPRDEMNPYVFANPHGPTGPVNESTLDDWWQQAREASGVTGPKGQPVWLHSLRHTFATDMATAGMDLEVLMQMCGWSDLKMARRYINIARRHRDKSKPVIDLNRGEVRALLGAARKGPKGGPTGAPVTAEEVLAE